MCESISHFTMGLNDSSHNYVALILLSRASPITSFLLPTSSVCILNSHSNFVNKIFVILRLITKFMKILCHKNLELYSMGDSKTWTRDWTMHWPMDWTQLWAPSFDCKKYLENSQRALYCANTHDPTAVQPMFHLPNM